MVPEVLFFSHSFSSIINRNTFQPHPSVVFVRPNFFVLLPNRIRIRTQQPGSVWWPVANFHPFLDHNSTLSSTAALTSFAAV
jgi:hypothetical protein